jgi:hypothetical protein
MISMDKNGGRTIHLFIPFEHNKKKIESITLATPCFGHTLRWNDGDWPTSVALLVELAGVEEAIIRSLRYPDADRVMEQFLSMLPPEIRNDIAENRIPVKRSQGTPEQQLAEATAKLEAATAQARARVDQVRHGDGAAMQDMQGPGDPLPQDDPETGFDLSDEA